MVLVLLSYVVSLKGVMLLTVGLLFEIISLFGGILGILTGFIQALIFTVLTAVYIGGYLHE